MRSVVLAARAISLMWNKPSVSGAENQVVLCVSGLNTHLMPCSHQRYRIFGETLGIAVENCLNRLARTLKIPNEPSPGYSIEQLANNGEFYIPLPYTLKGIDLSMSGISAYIDGIAADRFTGKNTRTAFRDDGRRITTPDLCYKRLSLRCWWRSQIGQCYT